MTTREETLSSSTHAHAKRSTRFIAGLPFPCVGSFVVYLHACPFIDRRSETSDFLNAFYYPLIWLGFRIERLLRWIAERSAGTYRSAGA